MITVDPRLRARLTEIKQHVWVNEGYSEEINNYVLSRPQLVVSPNPQSLEELVSYGFRKADTLCVLSTEINLHPIVSLYHLIEELRQREEKLHLEYFEYQSSRKKSFELLNSNFSESKESVRREKIEKLIEKLSEDQKEDDQTSNTSSSLKKGNDKKIKGFFNVQVHSDQEIQCLKVEIERVLTSEKVVFENMGNVFYCQEESNKFEIEIIPSPNTSGGNDIILRRSKGNVWSHKRICHRILEELDI
jgi:Rad3-related DNA helicase